MIKEKYSFKNNEIFDINDNSLNSFNVENLETQLITFGFKEISENFNKYKDLIIVAYINNFLYKAYYIGEYELLPDESENFKILKVYNLENSYIYTKGFERDLKNEIKRLSSYIRELYNSPLIRHLIIGNIELDKHVGRIDVNNPKYSTKEGVSFVQSFNKEEAEIILSTFKPKYELTTYRYIEWYSKKLDIYKTKLENNINEYLNNRKND